MSLYQSSWSYIELCDNDDTNLEIIKVDAGWAGSSKRSTGGGGGGLCVVSDTSVLYLIFYATTLLFKTTIDKEYKFEMELAY